MLAKELVMDDLKPVRQYHDSMHAAYPDGHVVLLMAKPLRNWRQAPRSGTRTRGVSWRCNIDVVLYKHESATMVGMKK